jgi:transcription-repair coupling factor (superfamily II helicase)
MEDRIDPFSELLRFAGAESIVREVEASGSGAFVSSGVRPFLVAALAAEQVELPVLVVAPDDAAARALKDDLDLWLAPRRVMLYPTRGVSGGSHLAAPSHLVGLRLAALDALVSGGDDLPPVVVASSVALAELVPEASLRPHGFSLARGERIDLEALLLELVESGYGRVEQVSERASFAVRGDIVDIYPATADRAVRIELFDEEIESLRWFSTFTQRSLGEVDEVMIAPAAELSGEHREAVEMAMLSSPDEMPPISELVPLEGYRPPLELIGDSHLIIAADEQIRPSLADWWLDVEATLGDDAAHLHVAPAELIPQLEKAASVTLSAHEAGQKVAVRGGTPATGARTLKEAEPELERLARNGYRVVVAFPREVEADRAAWNLVRTTALRLRERVPDQGEVAFAVGALREGFIAPDLKLAVIPADRLVRRRPKRPSPRHGRAALGSFTDLRSGDLIVHEDHGVARFTGFDTKTVAGVTRDYLELEYSGGDRVFLPVEQFAKISRHVGAGGEEPTLSKLGGNAWERVKSRAKAAADMLAGELLNLYAERRRRTGHPFNPDGEEQLRFERAFPHRETPDQLDAIEVVKADMEAPRPMDRLICGDVGYGKTEVALRAAFKCAIEGRQVLLLVPTTILAQQHYGSFAERFANEPLIVDVVSRFRSAAEQREVVAAFNEGKVDVLVGTHRLLGKDLKPKDLGLIVVDEEQRFGVKQKELLRQLRMKTDVIAMSATPIPRTLQMSLAGVRDISVIETPPEGRQPVRTWVGEYDEALVRTALERELDRGGRAFVLHNRVETIEEAASQIAALVPQARIEIAHGSLGESDLEERMMRFVRGEADVLVCTSIIEAGIDIPEANTLIVERADLLGLSQLYQLRGRVGRGRERGHAYLFHPTSADLTWEASQRLSALSDHTELGSGFRIAMRDLEIRGAGNLLGAEQSGHVAALGFELYLKMLDEAVSELEGTGESELEPVRIDVPIDAYVPSDYVEYERAKIDIHRRIASATEVSGLEELKAELADRFGPVPDQVERLIGLQRARLLLASAGAREASFRRGTLAAAPVTLDSSMISELRGRVEGLVYESAKETVTVRVGEEPEQRYLKLVQVAEALAAVTAAGDQQEPQDGHRPPDDERSATIAGR